MSKKIQFLRLTLRNFLSFGNAETEIDLSFQGSTLVNGENIDTGGANGVGKTTLINAICYALYNKPKDNIGLQRLINTTNALKNTKMEVRLSFLKGEDEYEVYRSRGEDYRIEVTKNGEDITPDSIAESDRKIVEIIGMSYELFTRIIIFAGSLPPFLEMPISQQRLHIEELFNITLLSEKAVILKDKIKQNESDITVQEAILREQTNTFTIYQRHLSEAAERIERWELTTAESISNISNQLASVKDIDFDEEQVLHELKAELSAKKTAIDLRVNQLTRDLQLLTKELTKLNDEFAHLNNAKCPYCLQKYNDAAQKIQELLEKIELRKVRSTELSESIYAANVEKTSIINDLDVIQSSIKHENIKQLLEIQANAGILQAKLSELQCAVNPHIEVYEKLVGDEVREADYGMLDVLKNKLEHKQFLLKLLTDKNSFIRRKIINRSIPFLNAQLNSYTVELGLPHVVKFDADMSCTVSEYGRELDFGNLSSGEKKRVNLAMSLAFRDVMHHLHAKVNLLFADEIDMSLDTSGVDAVIKLLKRKSRDEEMGVWVVMHRPEAIGRFEREIIIRKENGFSSIIYETT